MAKRRYASWLSLALIVFTGVLPAARGDDRILIEGAINGRPARFALDTGAGFPFVAAESKIGKFALTDRSSTYASPPYFDVVGTARAHTVTVFGRTYPDVSFQLIAAAPPNVLNEFDALMGWPAVRDGVLHLELGKNTASYSDTAPKFSWGWQTFPVIPAEVFVFAAGAPADSPHILVDTGLDDGAHLGTRVWMDWTSHHERTPYTLDAAYSPGQGILVRRQYFVSRFTIGDLVLHNVMVSEAAVPEQHLAGAAIDVVIGISALRHLDLIVDGARRVVHVREAEKHDVRQNYNRLGAVFVPRGEDFSTLTAIVAPGSPAASAGIRDGDVLVEVDGRPTSFYLERGVSFASLWSRPVGTHCHFALRRGEQVLRQEVVLDDYAG